MNHSERYDTKRLNAIPIISVVERLGGKVRRQGSTCRTLCPWHNDTNPSLVLYQDKGNRCKCFACGKSGSVIDYVMQVRNLDFTGACEWLAHEFNLESMTVVSREKIASCSSTSRLSGRQSSHSGERREGLSDILKRDDFNINTKASLHSTQAPTFIKMSYLNQFVSSSNSFCKCLRTIFPPGIVDAATHLYLLGCYSGLGYDDDVMFPSIDTNLKIHDIKIQHYDSNPDSPTFFHCDKKHIFWLSSLLKKDHNTSALELPDSPEASSPLLLRKRPKDDYGGTGGGATLFGAHLLPFNPDMPVVLVESPKNAVVGACALHDYVWVAAGNKNNLSYESLGCLLNRKVYVIPDHDALDEWRRELSRYEDITHFTFASFCDKELQQLGEKGDIADYVIKTLTSQ